MLSIEVDEARRTVVASGEVDLGNVDRLVEAAIGLPGTETIRLDLRGVSFIDSTGIRGLIMIGTAKGPLVLVAPSRSVRRVLDLLRLDAGIPLRIEDDPPPGVR